MKKSITIVLVIILLAFGILVLFLKAPGDQRSQTATDTDDGSEYSIQYEWPVKPRVGHYTLKVTVADKAGDQAQGIEIMAAYDMPSMRGHHRTEEKMKRNDNGYFLLPIYFAMRGDWEIILSVMKDGEKAAEKKINLSI